MERQLAGHDFLHRFAFGGEYGLAQRQHDALLDLLKEALRCRLIRGPRPQMNLNFTWRSENCRCDVIMARVNRRDALIDVRFSHPSHAHLARQETHARRKTRQARFHLCAEHGFQFVRRAGQENYDVSARFEPKTRRGSPRIFKNGCAFWHQRLPRVH